MASRGGPRTIAAPATGPVAFEPHPTQRETTMRAFVISTLLGVCAQAMAQAPAEFVGTWKVTWHGAKKPQEAKLVITDSGGTWRTYDSSRNNPCIGREVPISVKVQSPGEVAIDLKFSEALAGCSNSIVTLKRVDDRNLQGFRGSAEVKAVRDN
jgi:hypothetical protein